MNSSELITPMHLARKAIIYIRQSSPHQVLTNQESLRLQYALQQRALSLGWPAEAIEIIDADLGISGASTHQREGFKDIVTQVTLGQVGIILSIEVQRLSRNCSDWYPLLDICAFKNCLIADRDGIYDPASPNGRLLLGLKGQLSELELHTIRSRMTAGLLNKAGRGELALSLPMGLVRDEHDRVHKDPNLEIQARLELVFSTFLRVRSANQVLEFFNQNDLRLPRRDRFGDLVWKKPSVAAILSILKNPAYAGTFVYGRSRTTRAPTGAASIKRLPRDQWKIVVHDKYPAYIDWPTFEKIQAMLADNYAEYDRNKSRGIPRPGAALLHGILYCGQSGHKMVVEYKRGTRYLCNCLRQQHRVPVCENIPGDPIDRAVVAAFLQALAPVELDAYAQAIAAQQATAQQLDQAQQQQLERLRYEAALAQRQFNRVDPDNRLVAAELEKRWETALRTLQQAEETYFTHRHQQTADPPVLPPELQTAFQAIGHHLPQLWQQNLVSPRHKKALLRCLIDKVVIHHATPDTIQVRIVWRGGATTTQFVPIRVGSLAHLSGAEEMERLIVELSQAGKLDDEIAAYLTRLGHRSPMHEQVLPSTVKFIRLRHGIMLKRSQSHPRRIPGYLTVPQVTKLLACSAHWVYDRIHNGTILLTKEAKTGLYLFPDQPETLARLQDLKAGKIQNLRF